MTAPAYSVVHGDYAHEVTDTEVVDALETLELKPHEQPQGFASWNGSGLIRLPRNGQGRRVMAEVLTVAEARAWAVLLLREAVEAECCVEEQAKREAS